jgi:hypothetical protein
VSGQRCGKVPQRLLLTIGRLSEGPRSACPSAIIDAPLPRKPQASPRVKMPKPQPIDLAVLLAPSLDAQL